MFLETHFLCGRYFANQYTLSIANHRSFCCDQGNLIAIPLPEPHPLLLPIPHWIIWLVGTRSTLILVIMLLVSLGSASCCFHPLSHWQAKIVHFHLEERKGLKSSMVESRSSIHCTMSTTIERWTRNPSTQMNVNIQTTCKPSKKTM